MANSVFTPGDLVISVYGDGDGSGTYTDNQASPIVLEQIDPTTGAVVQITGGVSNGTLVNGELVLPQSVASGSGENVISGEYGSSSEGTLQLSANGQSLTIAGYGINAKAFNAAESNGNNTYGNAALAQTTSLTSGSTPAVARVVADINANGAVDTSTAVYNVFNTNNPRSVVTVDGSSFYIAGQGVSGDTTQGLFLVQDGTTTTSPLAINNATDIRTAEIYNGNLYTSADSKQPKSGGTSNISDYGTGLPTSATTPQALPGISQTVTLTAAQENSVNGSAVGKSVHLSPESYYFANSTTLYVADSGNPKEGGLGDGGLQKWVLNTSSNTWSLQYTLSSGLNLVTNNNAAGTTGLIGLTGSVSGNTVSLYATNATIGDTDQTYLYMITDNLAATTLPTSESFTPLVTAAPDTNIRGVAFAPQAAQCYVSGTLIRTATGDVAIEDLAIGDVVVTSAGAHRRIRWLGHRTVECSIRRHENLPIRIAAHAFGENHPARDLFVSPGHAICVDVLGEVLIPACVLVNGATIQQVEADEVTYWHVELDSHDVILAENLPAESFLDMGNRGFFAEGDIVDITVGPDADPAKRTHADFCRPFHDGGPLVEVVKAQLAKRAEAQGWSRETALDMHLVVDGRRVDPALRGLRARFDVPAGAEDVWLVSPTARPCDMSGSGDRRDLGLYIGALRIDDGFDVHDVAIDDPLLCIGFHEVEEGRRRWTAGRARLPAPLWQDIEGGFALRIELAGPPVSRWIPPTSIDRERLVLVA